MRTSRAARGGRRTRVGVAVAAGVVLAAATTALAARPAMAGGAACADVGVVFARGSGQPLAHREAPRFLTAVRAAVGGRSVHAYELGEQEHGGARYPAAGVGFESAEQVRNLLDAWLGIAGGTYRASVGAGATELIAYLAGRAADCPGERQVIGGYSQGAQAVGEGIGRLPASVRDRVAFVALFGDPRLALPEGRGLFPSACRGGARSPWRRGDVGCLTDNGVLGARDPYLPGDLAGRTGSWCDRDDPICNDNFADFARSTHARYSVGPAMAEAAAEVAARLGASPAAAL